MELLPPTQLKYSASTGAAMYFLCRRKLNKSQAQHTYTHTNTYMCVSIYIYIDNRQIDR